MFLACRAAEPCVVGARLPAYLCALVVAASGCSAQMLVQMHERPMGSGATFYEGGAGNAFSLAHGDSALLIDTKMGGYTARMRKGVELPGRQIRRVVLTHAHLDHSFGLDQLHDVGAVIVHGNTHRRMLEYDEHDFRAVPFVDVEREVRLFLRGEEVRILHPGVAHTDGDLVVYFPGRKLLVAGDLWNNGLEPEADFRFGGNILGLLRAYDVLLALDFDRVIPGHGPEGTRAGLAHARDYLAQMEKEVRAAVADGLTEDQTVERVTLPSFAPYQSVPLYASRPLNVRMMFRTVVEELRAHGPENAHRPVDSVR